ncbi:aspartate kinase [Hymenobacter baengnokdamensis]|uniref:aspartate kinase n=1 Tax=Hymenobacter baengnokdamensis TaxID=2615203 RepID=UPI00124450F8|nr:aspartate kinase [Hymenobacter baengnokdamensis]
MGKELTGLQVYKFGGASVKDAAAILNLCRIVRDFGPQGPLLIVVSAMGKTTNALEELYDLGYKGQDYYHKEVTTHRYHALIGQEVVQKVPMERIRPFGPVEGILKYHFSAFASAFFGRVKADYDEGYDQIVSLGERISAEFVRIALLTEFEPSEVTHLAATTMLRTNTSWREGRVDWPETERLTRQAVTKAVKSGARIIVTEGFIGGTADGRTTTLGREGSDYSAAIFAYCLNAESVTIWKDVPGLLNADPKIFPDTVLYPEISYQETIEMAFYGASVIHPKTLKPLAERHIPLRVKSFLNPEAPGTLIHDCQHPPLVPAFICKAGQCLLSFESKDFAFISEENLEVIFGALAQARLKINLMQNSAISFSVCTDYNALRVQRLLELLHAQFRVQYNTDLTLFTIKHYDQASIEQLTAGRTLLLEQRTRSTFQFLVHK